jgi:hypothetical protein
MDDIAPMLVLLTLILTTGGVILFRPLAKRLGDLLEIMAQQRRAVPENDDAARMREVVETMNARIALLEERQDFTDALLSASRSGTTGSELSEPLARSLPRRPVS